MAECIGNGDSSLQALPLTNDKISEYICKTWGLSGSDVTLLGS